MFRMHLDASALTPVASRLNRAPEIIREELRRFVEAQTAHLQGEVQERTPTAHGALRMSIVGAVRALPGLGVEGVVGSPLPYAAAVEAGAKPHMPPVEPLIMWARQKLGVRGREAESAGWAIARKISRIGTEGVGMFRETFEANERQIEAGFQGVLNVIGQRLEGES